MRIIEDPLRDPALPGSGEHDRLVTTLLDPTMAPAVEVACASQERWEIASVLDAVDRHPRLAGRPRRSQKPLGISQELAALLSMHDAMRGLLPEAARQAGLAPDRLRLVHARRVIQDALPALQRVASADLPRRAPRMGHAMAAGQVPARRPRGHPRVVKRKLSKFRRKRPAHRHLPQPRVRSLREAVGICADEWQDAHADWLLDLSELCFQPVFDIQQ